MRKIFLVFLCRLVIAAIILEFVHRVTSFDQDPPPFQPLIIIILAVPSVSATVREQESLQDPLNSKNLVQGYQPMIQANMKSESIFKKLTRRARRMVKKPQRSTKVTLQRTDLEESQFRKTDCRPRGVCETLLKSNRNPAQIELRTQSKYVPGQSYSIFDASHHLLDGIQTTPKHSSSVSSSQLKVHGLSWITSPCAVRQLECTPLSSFLLTPSPRNIFPSMDCTMPMIHSSNNFHSPTAASNDLFAAFLLGAKWACMNRACISGCSHLRL